MYGSVNDRKYHLTFWGLIASPYQLKMQALADGAGIPWQRWPDQAPSSFASLKLLSRLRAAQRKKKVMRFRGFVPGMDEYPGVPFYTSDGRAFYYDSSDLAYHLDSESGSALVPEPADLRFVCQLLDEAFDEFGLYMVHHNRWIVSAADNRMGEVSARELGPIPGWFARRALPRRQVRRCPYLFSVAPDGYSCGVAPELTPPARAGFPSTHDLLDIAWCQYLAAVEGLLEQQPYLLGERFTLADAAAYGQLSMNLIDGTACERLQAMAPRTYQWLCDIRDGRHVGSAGEIYLSDRLRPLLGVIESTFIDLMRQNALAYNAAVAAGETLFNEAAFDAGRALYDGQLEGRPFRAVVKTFQVEVWRTLCQSWESLDDSTRAHLCTQYPALNSMNAEP